MIRSISKKFIKFITEDKYDLVEREEMEYVLNVFIFEILKILGAIMIFSMVGYYKESLIIMISTIIVKPYIGGYHEESQMRCFIATLLFTGLELIMGIQSHFSFTSNLLIIILCEFCIYHRAPVINSNMPITHLQAITNNRKKGLRNSIVLGIISIVLHNYSNYYSFITWSLIISTLLMFNKRKKES